MNRTESPTRPYSKTPRLALVFLSLVVHALWNPAFAADSGPIFGIQFENDMFGGGTDRHFTHGTRIYGVTKPIAWIANAAGKIPWFDKGEALEKRNNRLEARTSLSLGQNIFTPENISETELLEDDRPYAGWLYLGFGIAANQGSDRFDQLELNVGVVGPSSQAEDVQTTWHDWFDLKTPNGWEHQIEDEFGAVLFYEQARRLEIRDWILGLKWDFVPHFGGAAGNVFTFAKAGFTFRLGPDLSIDFGPPRIRPSLPGSGFYKPDRGLHWYLFAGVEGRLVLRNVFLDGGAFHDTHSVDKKPLTGDAQAGIVMQYNRLRVFYTQIFRAKEYDGQKRADKFGSFGISYQF